MCMPYSYSNCRPDNLSELIYTNIIAGGGGGASPVAQTAKNLSAMQKTYGLFLDLDLPGSGRSPGEGHGNPLQYSCLENPMDRGA